MLRRILAVFGLALKSDLDAASRVSQIKLDSALDQMFIWRTAAYRLADIGTQYEHIISALTDDAKVQ